MYQACGHFMGFQLPTSINWWSPEFGLPSTVAVAILRFFTETVTVTKFYWSIVKPLTGNSFQQKGWVSQCEKQMMVFRPKKVKLLLKNAGCGFPWIIDVIYMSWICFCLVILYGVYHRQSPWQTTIWDLFCSQASYPANLRFAICPCPIFRWKCCFPTWP